MAVDGAPRIAFFLATSGHSGVDRLMKNLIPAIARRGYVVDLLHVRKHGPEIDAPGVRVVDLGARHVWSALPALVRYLRRERPAVMLSDKDKVNRAAVFARALAGVATRLVLRSGTTISVDLAHRGALDRWLQRNSMRWIYPRAQAVVTPSEASRRDLIDYTGLDAALVRALPSPLLPQALFNEAPPPPAHRWFVADAPPLILGVGELSPRKDFATLIRGFARLRQTREARLIILGRGGQLEALRSLAAELGVADDVDFPGFTPEVFRYMAHAAVFVMCSRWEGLGNVIVEALACGTPVIATDAPGGAHELLRGGEVGPLIAVGDDAALARELASVLATPKNAARQREVAQPYEIEAATSGYLAVLGLPPQPASPEIAR